MTPGVQVLVGFIVGGVLIASRPSTDAASSPDPDKDGALTKLLEEGRTLIDSRKPQAAIELCEKVIAAFQTHYAKSDHVIYCARTQTENLGYLLMAAAAIDKGTFEKGKRDAIVLSQTWSAAYFMKGYALQELGRRAEAKAAVNEALKLSPWNAQYLAELGALHSLEKNWTKAREVFEKAEEHAEISPDNAKASDLARARRGLGYVLVELGQLDEAEKKYQQCLKDDPNDTKAAAELEYVRGLKAKAKSR